MTSVWERAFANERLARDFEPSSSVSGIVVTEAPFAPKSIQDELTEIVFETFRFSKCHRAPAAALSAFGHHAEHPQLTSPCCLVVDSGHSFTHVVPVLAGGEWVRDATRRVDVGGKLLTNLLKEITSYRHWNMMDETKLMRDALHDLCFVSLDFRADLAEAATGRKLSNRLWRQYLLPDYRSVMRGKVVPRPDADGGGGGAQSAMDLTGSEQLLTVNNERFVVPEVLFNPGDIGIDQEASTRLQRRAIRACAAPLRLMCANVLLTGGNSLIPNALERLERSLRSLVPPDYELSVSRPDNPALSARGGVAPLCRLLG